MTNPPPSLPGHAPTRQPARGMLRVFDNPDALADGVADWIGTDAAATVATNAGRFVVSLSGGSTPKRLYEKLATRALPWDRMVWTFGDERFVPPDSPASNAGMVQAALFSRAPVSAATIHPFRTTGLTADQSATAYETLLRQLAGPAPTMPLFDLTLLGLGDDGHTASLIPGQPVVNERERWVAAVPHGRDNVRLSLTLPAIDNSRRVAFLVTGAGKRAMLDRILGGDTSLPAGRVRPEGDLVWFVDREAAGAWAP